MSALEFFLMGVGLSMDAFAVAVCKGLAMRKVNMKQCFVIALFFGGFQALMPLIGFYIGSAFANYITKYDHWIAFALLLYIGGKMAIEAIKEWRDEDTVEEMDPPLDYKNLFIMAVATSIDALACGVTFSFYENVNIYSGITIIGITTFILSIGGVFVGNLFGSRYKAKAQLVGGLILIFLGVKVVLEHVFGIYIGF